MMNKFMPYAIKVYLALNTPMFTQMFLARIYDMLAYVTQASNQRRLINCVLTFLLHKS